MYRNVGAAAIRCAGGKRSHQRFLLQRQQQQERAVSSPAGVLFSAPSSAESAKTCEQTRVSSSSSSNGKNQWMALGGICHRDTQPLLVPERRFFRSSSWQAADDTKAAAQVPTESATPAAADPETADAAASVLPEAPPTLEAPVATETPREAGEASDAAGAAPDPEPAVVDEAAATVAPTEKAAPKDKAAQKEKAGQEEKVAPAAASVLSPSASVGGPPSTVGGPPVVDGVKQYSTPELTKDAAKHKAGLEDPTRPDWQNPLHHDNPDMQKIFQEDFSSDAAFEAAVNPAPPVDDGSGKIAAPAHLHDLADQMVNLTMLEMNELINRIADHYGFHEGMLSPDDSSGGEGGGDDDGDGAAAAPVAEKTAFDVRLVSYDASIKIKIIKEVRVVVPGLGLKEAKELVEGAPIALQKGVSKEVADQIKAKLEALGAVMEIV